MEAEVLYMEAEVATNIFHQRNRLFAVFGNHHDLKANKVFFQLLSRIFFNEDVWNKIKQGNFLFIQVLPEATLKKA